MTEIDCPSPPGPVGPGRLELTFIGTATVLLRAGRFTVLTDPNFLHRGERAYLGLGMWSRRRTDPAMRVDDLPALDAVVLSHHHGDHFDRRSATGLDHDLPIITEPHAAAKLRRQGFTRPVPLATWQSATLRRGDDWLRVVAAPATHAPAPLDRLLPPVMGSILEWGSGAGAPWLRAWVSGDTLLHDRLAEIPARYPDLDLAVLHLGGTRVAGVLVTMDGRQGVEALRAVRPAHVVPVHQDDYTVFKSPPEDFTRRFEAAGLPITLHQVGRGETWAVDAPVRPGAH